MSFISHETFISTQYNTEFSQLLNSQEECQKNYEKETKLFYMARDWIEIKRQFRKPRYFVRPDKYRRRS